MERDRALDGAARLFEEPRIAVALPDLRFDDGGTGRSVGVRRLPLPAAGLVLLASLIRAERLSIESIVSGNQTFPLPRHVLVARGVERVGRALQNLADGRLADVEHGGDLALRVAGRVELPGLRGAALDHGPRFVAACPATRPAAGPRRARHGRAGVSWRTAVCPVNASQRSTAICT